MGRTRRIVGWNFGCGCLILGAAASFACHRNPNDERAALQNEAKAIEARHVALDKEIATWSENVGRFMKEGNVEIDPARVVLGLSSRSFFLHETQHHPEGSAEPAYAQLEDQMKDIQTKRKAIETDWLALLARVEAANQRAGIKSTTHEESFTTNIGDPTIPIPGVSARATCCKLVIDLPSLGTTCRNTGEHCAPGPQKNTWVHVCEYLCDPIILQLN
jgi:hypothetical protein